MKNIDKEKNIKLANNPPPLRIELNSVDDNSQFAENIINTVREPLIVLDQDLKVVTASRSFYNFFKVNIDETIGKHIYDLGNHQWNIPKLRELLETILPEKTTFDNYEVEHEFSTIGKRIMLLNARQIERAFGKEKIILLTIEDITERKHEEEALSEKNRMTSEYLDILLDHAHAPIIIWNSSLVIKRFNREFEKLSGYASIEVIDKKIDILFPKDKIDSTLELIKNTLNVKNVEVIEIDILTKDKDIRTVLWNSAIIFDEEGINTAATIAQDITKHKQTEDALTILETRYRRLFESAKDGILILDAKTGMIIDVNPFMIELLGYSHEKFVEKAIWEIGFFKDIVANEDKFFELQQEEYIRYENLPLETFEGRKINVEFVSNVYLVNNQKVIQCNIRDITERVRVDKTLWENEKRFRELFDNAPVGYHELDINGRITRINLTEMNMLGYSLEEMIGQFAWKFTGDEGMSRQRVIDKLKGTLIPTKGEERIYRCKDQTTFSALVEENILRDSENNIIGIRATIQNITKLRNAEEELRKLSRAIEQSPVSVVITNPYGNIEYVNKNFCVITGYSKEEVIGKNLRILNSHYHDNKFYEELWNTILSGKEWKGEILNKKKNGDLYWESELIFSLVNNNGDITEFITIKEDITEQKKVRSELLISEERYKAIFNSSLELVYIFDLEGQILEVNDLALNLFGYTLEESKSLKLSDILDPGDLPTAFKNIEYVIANGVNQASQEYRLRTKKGGEIFIETTAVRLDKDGKPYAVMGIARNVTERKHNEKELIEAKENAEEMNRLKTNFLANMSHELRTPLIGILGYAEFLENELTDKELQRMANIIKSSGKRLHNTLNNILDISRIETRKQRINLKKNDLIKYLIEQVELFKAAAEGKGLLLNFETKEEILKAYIDEEMFISIISNLLSNAIKYTNTGGVTLIAKREEDNAVIEVIDTGIGVPENLYNLIFEPFRQASEGYGRSFEGTGLGLTLVKKYIDLMHGTIVLNSKPAEGSTFILKLPIHKNIAEVIINTNWM